MVKYVISAWCWMPQSLRTSSRHQAEAQTAYVYMGLRFHQGLGQQGAWTTDGIMGLWRGPVQTVNLPSSLAFVFTQSQGAPVTRFWGWICICLSSRLLYTIHWPCWATAASRAQACLSSVTVITSPVLSTALQSTLATKNYTANYEQS